MLRKHSRVKETSRLTK